jgi:hypothetical protein
MLGSRDNMRASHHSIVLTLAGNDPKAKAAKAAKAVKKSVIKKYRKPRYSTTFHRPKTLKRTRDPKYARQRCAAASTPSINMISTAAGCGKDRRRRRRASFAA